MRKQTFLRFSVVVILFLSLSACQGSTPRGTMPIPTSQPTFTVTPMPKPTATLGPWPTRRPMATSTPIPLFPLEYEHVPVTPLSPEAVARRARDLACEPPCWFGLEPGVSTLQDLRDLWESWSKIRWGWNEQKEAITGHFINPAFYMAFEANRQGRLVFMRIEPFGLPEYSPSVYFRDLGQPPWTALSAVWSYPSEGEQWAPKDSFISVSLYLGYPEKFVAADLYIGDTPDLGLELPPRLQACIPHPRPYITFFAFPKENFTAAWIWQYQDEADPPARFLTSREEIWQQILEEKDPFCITLEFEE